MRAYGTRDGFTMRNAKKAYRASKKEAAETESYVSFREFVRKHYKNAATVGKLKQISS